MRKIIKWFDINIGWFFVNGNKIDDWNNYINKKYNETDSL